jgi:hypothetical protein
MVEEGRRVAASLAGARFVTLDGENQMPPTQLEPDFDLRRTFSSSPTQWMARSRRPKTTCPIGCKLCGMALRIDLEDTVFVGSGITWIGRASSLH